MMIEVADVGMSCNKLQFRLRYSKPLRKYFLNDTFFVEYDSHIDLGNVDESILVIPIVSMIVPIAWAVGADVRLRKLDQTYLQSLNKIKDIFRAFYPSFSFSSSLEIEDLVLNQSGGDRTGLLFSGGVDCTTSYVRHRDEKPDLISIWGTDHRLHEEARWNRLRSGIRWLANRDGVTALEVKTDISCINMLLLGYEFGFSWYSEVAHGLMLLGLCAPVTVARTIGSLLIAASFYEGEETRPWGSLPSTDNNVSWANVTVSHDGYELSRQQKLKYVSNIEPERFSHLWVCQIDPRANCVNCEKCFRTITGLALEGIDPRNCNFNIDMKVFARIKDLLLSGKMPVASSERDEWIDIQRHIPGKIEDDICGSREFFTWFRQFDLSKQTGSKIKVSLWHYRLEFSRIWRDLKDCRKVELIKWLVLLARCYLYTAFARVRKWLF